MVENTLWEYAGKRLLKQSVGDGAAAASAFGSILLLVLLRLATAAEEIILTVASWLYYNKMAVTDFVVRTREFINW